MSLQVLSNNLPYKDLLNKAKQQFYNKQYHPSLNSCQQAIALAPEKQEAYIVQGKVNSFLGRYDQAENSFKKATMLNDKCSEAYYQYGYTLNRQKKYLEGLKMFEKGISRDPLNNSFAYLGRAHGLAETGHMKESEKNIEYACKALNELGKIGYISGVQRQIIKSGIQKYSIISEHLEKNKKLNQEQRNQIKREFIQKVVQATQLQNHMVLDNSFTSIMNNSGRSGNIVLEGNQKKQVCNCTEGCRIF